MLKKIIMLTLLIIMAILAFSACSAEQAGQTPVQCYDALPPNEQTEQTPAYDNGTLPPAELDNSRLDGGGLEGPANHCSLEGLLADMAIAKFDEANRFGSEGHFVDIMPVRKLYMPLNVPERFELVSISSLSFPDDSPIDFIYAYMGGNPNLRARFIWQRDRPTDEVRVHMDASRNYVIFRAQYGYWFQAQFPSHAGYTEQDLYEFSHAQPVIAWELRGNAVSVSIQGMGDVRILDENGHEIAIEPTTYGHGHLLSPFPGRNAPRMPTIRRYTLYRTAGESRSVAGYRWTLDEELERWQYVLETGTYTFVIEGAIIDELGLLVRHFDDHEIVSEVDYGAELDGSSGFTLTVTLEGSSLTINE